MTVASNTPYDQYTATGGQTVFNYTFEIVEQTNLLVYQTPTGDDPDDATQLLTLTVDYTVTGVGNENGGTVVLVSGATLNDIVTIKQNVPVARDTAFTPGGVLRADDLNLEFDNQTLIGQVSRFNEQSRTPHYQDTDIVTPIVDTILPVLGANQIWAKNNANDAIIVYDVPSSGTLAPGDATYILQTPDSDLPNAQAMSALGSGLVVGTTGTGVLLTRTLTGTANQIALTFGSGIGGDPVVAIAANPILPGTEYFKPPQGTTAQRPGSPADGMVRYNTDLSALEVFEGSIWDPLSGGVVDSILGTANQISIDSTDPTIPVVALASNPVIPGSGGVTLPTGTTAQRAGILGTIRFNSQTSEFEGTTDGASWNTFQTSAGTVLSVSGTANQIDSTGGANPILSLSSTANMPGTFNIQSTTAINAIINDSTLATATTTNIATASALKTYIDSIATGLNIQGSCVCASTNALTVTYANGASGVGATLTNAGAFAAIALDGVSPTVGQRVLIKNQASSLQNGIYTVTTVGDGVSVNWVLTRATDFDTPSEIQPGDLVVLTGGTTQTQSSWLQTATVATVGTDAVTFVQFTASLPMTVPNGGTGVTSFTAYAPIIGGTTTTGALQSVALGSAGSLFQSAGVGALPGFTTTTYPTTNAINTIMYASGANVLGVITPVNSAVLISSAAGVPSFSTTLPSGIAATNMSLTTPSLGVATATSINKVTITAPATSAVLTIADGKTLTASNTLTFTGTDGSSVNFGTGGTVLYSTGSGGLKSFQIFTSGTAATYTKPAGVTSIYVECIAGGGGGGGIAGAASSVAGAGGGGGGGYCKKYYSTAAATYTYTVGGGGAGGAAGANNGSTGSNTTFNVMTANGGVGGQGVTAASVSGTIVPGGVGGGASGGDLNLGGYVGQAGVGMGNSSCSGAGGGSALGGGAVGVFNNTLTTTTAGGNGGNYGGGGSGAVAFTGTTNRAGGNGGGGVIVVWEFA